MNAGCSRPCRVRSTSVAFVLSVLLTCLCAGAESPARPNIIFILIDDLRWDEVDYPFVKVPNIQRIAAMMRAPPIKIPVIVNSGCSLHPCSTSNILP